MKKSFLLFRSKHLLLAAAILLFACQPDPQTNQKTDLKSLAQDYPIKPVAFTQVNITDNFWAPRLETNRKVTIPYNFQKCEETGRIRNFAIAGGLEEGEFEGIYFNDSDVFKVIEGASYSLQVHDDPELKAYLDDLIAKIAAAQEDDGYLYTNRTIDPSKAADGGGVERWTSLPVHHELYNVGHMYEAAVAHYQATGERSLLDVAIKNADLIDLERTWVYQAIRKLKSVWSNSTVSQERKNTWIWPSFSWISVEIQEMPGDICRITSPLPSRKKR